MFDEPEDIFAGTNPPPNLPVGGPLPSAKAPVKPTDSTSVRPLNPPTPVSTVAPPSLPDRHVSSRGILKTVLVIGIVLVIIATSAVLSYLALFRKSSDIIQTPAPANTESSSNQQTPTTNTQTNSQPLPVQPTPETSTKIVDADSDGLSDTQEIEIGTDPRLVDTDTDGLSDREEVQVYKTDPLKADTDGDTYKDGEEVRNGYNPKGNGKLFSVPTP